MSNYKSVAENTHYEIRIELIADKTRSYLVDWRGNDMMKPIELSQTQGIAALDAIPLELAYQ